MNNPGTRLVNTAKYNASRFLGNHKIVRQPHAAFHFLLDYIPHWIQSYGSGGLIQYQSFIATDKAADVFREMLHLTQVRGLPSYLVVLKRHRPDNFLLSHALDGYSLALDFKVTPKNRERLQILANDLNEIVLEAGGRFYFAKDSTLTSYQTSQFLGDTTIKQFRALKDRCDPDGLLQTDLYRRLFSDS
ncbi:MAG: FAD-binding oxidoreductase [Chloroflexi bacterium]|nr:FAD-binding oxidoreductase [Chloroflexota bacterium]